MAEGAFPKAEVSRIDGDRPQEAGVPALRQITIGRQGIARLLRELISRGVPVALPVRGSSMHPLIRSGDVVTLAPVNGEPVAVGSVVAAEVPGAGGLVVHRVVGRSRTTVLLRGDNGVRPDGEVPEAAVLGTVVRVERDGRVVSALPAALRRPHALLVRAGVVRRLNRLRGLVAR